MKTDRPILFHSLTRIFLLNIRIYFNNNKFMSPLLIQEEKNGKTVDYSLNS